MDTIMQLSAYGDNADSALSKAREEIERIATLLSATDQNSALLELQNGDTLSADFLVPFQTAKKISDATDGALDLSLYPITNAWGFYTKNYRVPTEDEIAELLNHKALWSLDGGKLLCDESFHPDLGSVAKGYASQRAVEVLKENGVTSAILSLGGNVQTIGQKPDGSDWTVSVADPLNTEETVGNLRVGECAVVTSGSYQRNFTENGKTYHHILNPKTGFPAENGLLSVTVICDDGTLADGLSTALFVQGKESASLSDYFSFEALYITEKKEIYLTPGLSSVFECTNETYKVIEIDE